MNKYLVLLIASLFVSGKIEGSDLANIHNKKQALMYAMRSVFNIIIRLHVAENDVVLLHYEDFLRTEMNNPNEEESDEEIKTKAFEHLSRVTNLTEEGRSLFKHLLDFSFLSAELDESIIDSVTTENCRGLLLAGYSQDQFDQFDHFKPVWTKFTNIWQKMGVDSSEYTEEEMSAEYSAAVQKGIFIRKSLEQELNEKK